MCGAPCTLFWPRSGLMPVPGLPMLPVSSARLTSAMMPRALDMLGHAEPVNTQRRLGRGVEPRRRADLGGGHAADLLDLLRRKFADKLPVFLVLGDARAEEFLVDEALLDDGRAHGVEEQDIRARVQLEMDRGKLVQLDHPRIDDDQIRAMPRGLLDAGARHRVAVRRVRAAAEDGLGDLDLIERGCRGARAERHLHRRGGGRMADARATIDVVRAEDDPREFLRDKILLVGAAGGTEHPDAVGTMLGDGGAQARGNVGDDLVPADLHPLAVAADHRRGDAFFRINVVEGIAALHAGVAVVARTLRRADGRDLAVARADVHLAAGAAVGADGLRPFGRHAPGENREILERARWAGVDTRAAAHATAVEHRLAAERQDARGVAAIPRLPHKLALDLLADAHATVAGHALRHVDVDVGVRRILHERHLGRGRGARAAGLHAVLLQIAVKLLVGKCGDRLGGIVRGEQPEQGLAHALVRGRMRLDFHAVADLRVAGGHERIHALHLDRTRAAGAIAVDPVVVAERGDLDADLAQGLVDGEALHQLVRLAVDGYLKHGSISVG